MVRRQSPQPSAPPACAFGFDLGITNGQVGFGSAGTGSLVRDQSGTASVPMMVSWAEGKVLVGQAAKRQLLINPATVSGIMRLVGRRFDSAAVNAIKRRLPFRISADQSGGVAVWLGERSFGAEAICALLLQRLRQVAEAYMGEAVSEVHVAVPAHFDSTQREAVRSAAERVGLTAEVLEAPRAALRAFYPQQLPAGTRQAIVHLGGGSAEVTLLEVGGIEVEQKGEGGDGFLGGDLLDSAIAQLLLTESEAAQHPELMQDPLCMQRIREAAEHAKWEAGERGEATIELRHLHTVGEDDLHLGLSLTRERLAQLASPLISGLLEICSATLDRARLGVDEIDGLVLVGGQCRLPFVRSALADLFQREPLCDPEPEGTVARGAALEGLQQRQQAEEILELDVPRLR
jgi:molecular chaperone DnaK